MPPEPIVIRLACKTPLGSVPETGTKTFVPGFK